MHLYILGLLLISVANSNDVEVALTSYNNQSGPSRDYCGAGATVPDVKTPVV